MRTVAALLLLSTVPAHADSYCDVLLGYIHDAPANAILTDTVPDRAGPQTVTRTPLPGAHCLVLPYNPTGVKTQKAEQSVNCFLSASQDGYRDVFDSVNARVAGCLGQTPKDDSFTQRFEYDTNYSFVRVSADQMTNDWAISVVVMPVD